MKKTFTIEEIENKYKEAAADLAVKATKDTNDIKIGICVMALSFVIFKKMERLLFAEENK